MSIAFWQVVIVLGVVVFIFSRKSILKGIKDFIRGVKTPKHEIDAMMEKSRRIEEEFERNIEEREQKEKERQKEEQRKAREKERATASEPRGGGLTSKISRLKKLYKNGTLTKAEFEKAKNNLLK